MPGKLIRGDSQCKWEVNEKWKVVERKIIPWENRPIVNEKWIQRISFAWSRERKRNESQRIFFCGSLFQLVFLFSRNYWRFAGLFSFYHTSGSREHVDHFNSIHDWSTVGVPETMRGVRRKKKIKHQRSPGTFPFLFPTIIKQIAVERILICFIFESWGKQRGPRSFSFSLLSFTHFFGEAVGDRVTVKE